MVRYELLSALAVVDEGLILIPTLVEDSSPPPSAALPVRLRPLLRDWNIRSVSESGWEDDTRRLIAEIAAASRLQVLADVGRLLETAAAAGEQLAVLEGERQLQADYIAALPVTVDDLTRQPAEARTAEDRATTAEAFAALARGDTLAAEDTFEQESERYHRAEQSARLARAEALRNVANLANLRNVRKAVEFYRKALEAQPDQAETELALGWALIDLGHLAEAKLAFQSAIDIARTQGDVWTESAALIGVGTVLVNQGDLTGALQAFRDYMAIAETLAARDPGNARWQRDLSVSHEKIGDVLVAKGDLTGALQAFRDSMAIRETLAARDPDNAHSQRDLSVSHNKIGDVLVAQGNLTGALQAFRDSMAIRETLAARDPDNVGWQRNLSVSHERIGDVLVAQGNLTNALQAFRDSMAIRETLAARDPDNAGWQRNLSVSHERIGDVLVAQSNLTNALQAFRDSMAIREALAARDPDNAGWRIDVAVSCARLGKHSELSTHDQLTYLTRGMTILEALAGADHLPPNQDWRPWFQSAIEGLN